MVRGAVGAIKPLATSRPPGQVAAVVPFPGTIIPPFSLFVGVTPWLTRGALLILVKAALGPPAIKAIIVRSISTIVVTRRSLGASPDVTGTHLDDIHPIVGGGAIVGVHLVVAATDWCLA